MTSINFQRGDRLRLTKAGKSCVGTVRWCEALRVAVDLDDTLGGLYLATQDWIEAFNEQYDPNNSSFELVDDYEIEKVKSEN